MYLFMWYYCFLLLLEPKFYRVSCTLKRSWATVLWYFWHITIDFPTPGPANIYNAPWPSLTGFIWHPRCPSCVSSHTESHTALISPLISPLTHQRQAIRRTCLAIKARLEPGLMRLRSHTLSPQHFAKVISYPTCQMHGSQRVKCSSSLVGGKKSRARIRSSSFHVQPAGFHLCSAGKDGRGERERESECGFPASLECGFPVASYSVHTTFTRRGGK